MMTSCVPDVLDLDPVPALARVVGRGQRLADHPFQGVGQADGPDVGGAAGIPRRRPDRVGVQAELGQPLAPPGIGHRQQRLAVVVQQVEQVQLDRGLADQAGGRVPDVHPGLQQPEVRAPLADRDDLPVHDDRAAHPLASTASSG
jgi:hypothetical protein